MSSRPLRTNAGTAVHRVEHVLNGRPDPLLRAPPSSLRRRLRGAREVEQVRVLGVVELQRPRERLEHRVGDAGGVAAFETGVVVDADAGEDRDFFAAKAGDAARATAVGAQARLLRRDSGAPRGQELTDLVLGVHDPDSSAARRLVRGPASTWINRVGHPARARASVVPPPTQGEDTVQKRTLGTTLEVSAIGLGCMSMSFGYGPPADRQEMISLIRDGGRARRHVLRHRPGVRPVHQRGARRRGARPGPRPGRDRDQVRLRALDRSRARVLDSRPETIRQSVERSLERLRTDTHRPPLPAPRRPERADRGRRRHREGADRGGEGQALRPLRGRRADDPPRPRRPAGDRAAERVLALVARAGGADPAGARGARDRLRSLQPARQGLPDREDRRDDRVRRATTSATPSRASTRTHGRRIARSSSCWPESRNGRTRRPRRSRSRGCSRRSRGSSRSPARRSCIAWRRTSPRPTSSSRPTTSGRSTAPPRRSRPKARGTRRAQQRMIDR